MKEISNEVRITSVELVELINQFREVENNKSKLQHKHFMAKIRKEIETLKTLGLRGEPNFCPSSYVNSQNKEQPCYSLNRDGMLQMLNSESVLVRYKTIEYINALEDKLRKNELQLSELDIARLKVFHADTETQRAIALLEVENKGI